MLCFPVTCIDAQELYEFSLQKYFWRESPRHSGLCAGLQHQSKQVRIPVALLRLLSN